MKFLLIILLPFFLTTGDTFPTSGTNNAEGGAQAWSNPGNITADDGSNTQCNSAGSSQYLTASAFNFDLPAGATITKIIVKIEASENSTGDENLNVRINNASGAAVGVPQALSISGTSMTVYTYEGSTTNWSASPTVAMVEDADFGCRIWFNNAHDISIDYVTMAIEYTVGTGFFRIIN